MVKIIDINKKYTDCTSELDKIQKELDELKDHFTRNGFVYLLKINDNIYKIGMSDIIGRRGKRGDRLGFLYLDLLREGYNDFMVVFLMISNAPKQLEERLHEEFKAKKVEGKRDYFYLTNEDISCIRIIAETISFRPEIPKPRKYRTEPGSIEDFLNKIFGKKDELIAVARVLAGSPGKFLNVKEVYDRMPIKYYEDIIKDSLLRIESDYKYIDKLENSYKLNDKFWEDYRKRKPVLDLLADVILRPETDDDRQKLEAAGMAHCPSCGNPVSKSDIFLLENGTYCCLTEYFQLALKRKRGSAQRDSSYVITVRGLPGVRATGVTEEQCRLNLIEEIRIWIKKQQQEGQPIPDLKSL